MKTALACIIMASGHSTRFGSNKLLTNVNGKPMVQHIIEKVKMLGITVVVVTRFPKIAELCQKLAVDCVLHQEPYQNDTIRIGLQHLLKQDSFDGFMFCTGDQPFLTIATLQSLIKSFEQQPTLIHRLQYEEQPGNPVIFPASFVPQLLTLPQDNGGSYIIKQHSANICYTPTKNEFELQDIDTIEDKQKLFLQQ